MKYLVLVVFFYMSVFAFEKSDKLFECTEIFKIRKGELLIELERIDEQKQALEALKSATEDLLKQREAKVSYEAEIVEVKRAEVLEKEASIKFMLKENEEVLKQISSIKLNKIAQTYSKMKPAASAKIFSDMDKDDAALILQSLKPKIVGKILTKMDAKKASDLTLILAK
ncbi:MAG: PDP protein [Sulfurimonas sp.]|nr:PDP protein [Sulfurimonas sp.]